MRNASSVTINTSPRKASFYDDDAPATPTDAQKESPKRLYFDDEDEPPTVNPTPPPTAPIHPPRPTTPPPSSRPETPPPRRFTQSAVTRLIAAAPPVDSVKRALYLKAKKETRQALRKSKALQHRKAAFNEQRFKLRKEREDAFALKGARNIASIAIARMWRGKKARSVLQGLKRDRLQRFSDVWVERLIKRGVKNVEYKLITEAKNKQLAVKKKARAATQIQVLWSGFNKQKEKRHRWTEM